MSDKPLVTEKLKAQIIEAGLVALTKEEFNEIKSQMYELDEQVNRILAEPKVYASVARAKNECNLDVFKKGDRVSILDENLIRKKIFFGKIASDGVDKKGFLTVEFSNGSRERLNVGINGEKMQCKLIGDANGNPKDDGLNVTILMNGSMFEVHGLHGVNFHPGDQVLVDMNTKQIHQKSEITSPGFIATVTSEIDEEHVEVDINGAKRVVILAVQGSVKKDDRLMLDNSSSVAYKKLPVEEKDRFNVREEINIDWSDIAGLDEAKEQLIEAIEMPFRKKDVYSYYGMTPPKGVLLYGPPGCGKTLCGKAAAASLARLHGKDNFASGFIYVKGPELLSKWVGETEQQIRALFSRGYEHYHAHGYQALLFIDEADAILPMRGSGKSSDVEKTIVPQFLSCMDGLEESGVIVMLATNQPKRIDSAAIRDGRIDNHIKICRPNRKNAIDYFRIHMKDMPVVKGCDSEELAHIAVESIFNDSLVYFRFSENDNVQEFRLSDAVNGAMIAGLVKDAKSRAFRRDILRSGKPQGVMPIDIQEAVLNQYRKNEDMNLVFDIEDFCDQHGFNKQNVQVKKLPLAS